MPKETWIAQTTQDSFRSLSSNISLRLAEPTRKSEDAGVPQLTSGDAIGKWWKQGLKGRYRKWYLRHTRSTWRSWCKTTGNTKCNTKDDSVDIYISVLFYPLRYSSWVKPPRSSPLVYGEHNSLHTNLEFSFFSSNVCYQKLNPPRRVGVSTSATAYVSRGLSESERTENRPVLGGLQLKEYNPQTNPFFKPSNLSLESIHVVGDGASLKMETSHAVCVWRTLCNAYHMLFECNDGRNKSDLQITH